MAKHNKSIYVCQSCGYQTLKWMGRCPDCGQWSSMVEEATEPVNKKARHSHMRKPETINAISLSPEMRVATGLAEFDRTLGGGVVPGSLVLIGGDPGIGKSTIILQVLESLARKGCRALYLSGEESAQQIKLRAERLSVQSDDLYVMTGTCIEDFFEKLDTLKPEIIAVDSIQTLYTDAIASAPGSVGQVREVAAQLMANQKNRNI